MLPKAGTGQGVLHFPAHSLSGQWTQSLQSRAFPAPSQAMGPSAEQLPHHLEPIQYAQGSQSQCGRGGFITHPSRPHTNATSSKKPPLIFLAESDCHLL